ncbi:DNA repair protein SWI5 homolog [Pithys albifrons albifrons]|uniref:DNA repair protein SWI5 homolog n=1 Tax=Pithys albifrons albifrons TaxID=3385563 RepID=UPI003A5CAA61
MSAPRPGHVSPPGAAAAPPLARPGPPRDTAAAGRAAPGRGQGPEGGGTRGPVRGQLSPCETNTVEVFEERARRQCRGQGDTVRCSAIGGRREPEPSVPVPDSSVRTPEPSALAEQAPPSTGRSPPRRPPLLALPRRASGGGRRSGTAAFRAPVPSPSSFQANGASEEALQCEMEELKRKDLALDQEIAQLLSEGYSLEELEKHISLLHEYNEIKDAGQMLLGKLAVIRGVTTKQLYPEYDLELSD